MPLAMTVYLDNLWASVPNDLMLISLHAIITKR